MRDALDLILGGRNIDGTRAHTIGLVDDLVAGDYDALASAHAAVRDYGRDPVGSPLGKAFAARQAMSEH